MWRGHRPIVRALVGRGRLCSNYQRLALVFDDLFASRQPHKFYLHRPDRVTYLRRLRGDGLALINLPEVTLANDMITHDPASWAATALDLAARPPDSKKTFLATLRGMGGGKTRALEELRWNLLEHSSVLPLAYTYNGDMSINYTDIELQWHPRYQVCYAMTAVARLAAVFYGVSVPDMLKMLMQVRWRSEDPDYPEKLIRSFLFHAVQKTRRNGKDVQTVVVLVDEVARAAELFSRHFRLYEGTDITSTVRNAVLNAAIGDFNATLVMSTLDLTPLGATKSDRVPVALELGPLQPDRVTKQWWKKTGPHMHVAASVLADTPRFLEFAAEKINSWPPGAVNALAIRDMFNHVVARMHERVANPLPASHVLRVAMFSEETTCTNEILDWIARGLFVNSLQEKDLTPGVAITLIPIPSLFALSAAARNSLRGGSTSRYAKLVAEFPAGIQLQNSGRPLEWCAFWWLRMRLGAATKRQNMTIQQLLGLENDDFDLTSQMLQSMCRVTFDIPESYSIISSIPSGRIAQSYQNTTKFMEQLSDLGQDTNRVYVLKAAARDGWDILLAVFNTASCSWYLIFFDTKARRMVSDSQQADYVHSLRQNAALADALQGKTEGLAWDRPSGTVSTRTYT